MTASPSPGSRPVCPNCGVPGEPGERFCGFCGSAMRGPGICTACGSQVKPTDRFCENCGAPVAEPAPPEETLPLPPEQPVLQLPSEEPPVSAPVIPAPEPPREQPPPVSPAPPPALKAAGFIKGWVIIGVAVIAVIAIAIFAVLPGTGSRPVTPEPGVTKQYTTPTTQVVTVKPTATVSPKPTYKAGSESPGLTPGPTQVMPESKAVLVIVDQKDPVEAKFSVRFAGGLGEDLVKTCEVRLIRSDGQVISGFLNPSEKMDEVILPGTKSTDRVLVIVTLNTGEQYKIIDKQVPFSRG